MTKLFIKINETRVSVPDITAYQFNVVKNTTVTLDEGHKITVEIGTLKIYLSSGAELTFNDMTSFELEQLDTIYSVKLLGEYTLDVKLKRIDAKIHATRQKRFKIQNEQD